MQRPRGQNAEISAVQQLGTAGAFGVALLLVLLGISVALHPVSAQGSGRGLAITDVACLMVYAGFSVWVRGHGQHERAIAISFGARVGLMVGLVLVASHVFEFFTPFQSRTEQLVRGAGSVLLVLGLLGMAGSATWQRSRSWRYGLLAGLWCGLTGLVIFLGFALTANLLFGAHVLARLHDAFMASGMSDSGAFLVRNSLEASSELLLQMPIASLLMSLAGSLFSAWIALHSRRLATLIAWAALAVFVSGAVTLWYADSLPRDSRPPFVLTGAMAASLALCSLYPAWSRVLGRNAADQRAPS